MKVIIKSIEPKFESKLGNSFLYGNPYLRCPMEAEITLSLEEFFAMQEQFFRELERAKNLPEELTFKFEVT